jgi:hypothetical protein
MQEIAPEETEFSIRLNSPKTKQAVDAKTSQNNELT